MAEVIVLEHPSSAYLSKSIQEELTDLGIIVTHVDIERSSFPNGEKYYRLDVDSSFSLLGKTALYIAAITNDDEILDIFRVGTALTQFGIKRRVFVIPFLAYLSRDRASQFGEVVTAKSNIQMLGMIGAATEGNVFVFLDLHYSCVIHYFEGPCLRVELNAKNALLRAIADLQIPHENMMMGSTNLRRAAWVNKYARSIGIPVSFIREKPKVSLLESNGTEGVIGNVKDFTVIIYDDLIRSGSTIIQAANEYLKAGANKVIGMTTHFTCSDEKEIRRLIDSPIEKIIMTNSHPVTTHEIIRSCEKFVVVDVTDIFTQCLYEILPTPEHIHRSSI
ncbi:Ribose-phosphate pyrophosphokinase [Tritrichomonas foetus]|uniref:ribose-phosphate diphosphokinase n=1 Tax=Tritrichomonas foetus TaxID=1144522 RepID=A0A1J4J6L8_9EUKA|nr:Ribose-phosphate pyrophosphokinase [Tritrichomonas foetus]|eukprot:OHS93823.1 Ribose-phosphate pyrophosphokinase [Tritrichomonas foetus]